MINMKKAQKVKNYVKEHKKEILLGVAIGIGGVIAGNAAKRVYNRTLFHKAEKIEISSIPGSEAMKAIYKNVQKGGGIVITHVDIDKIVEVKDVLIKEIPNVIDKKVNILVSTDLTNQKV
jgi:hypothetical protein